MARTKKLEAVEIIEEPVQEIVSNETKVLINGIEAVQWTDEMGVTFVRPV